MIIKTTTLYDTGKGEFIPADGATHADVLVFVNQDGGGSGGVIATAIRTEDRKHFTWILSDTATVRSTAEVAARFAKGTGTS